MALEMQSQQIFVHVVGDIWRAIYKTVNRRMIAITDNYRPLIDNAVYRWTKKRGLSRSITGEVHD